MSSTAQGSYASIRNCIHQALTFVILVVLGKKLSAKEAAERRRRRIQARGKQRLAFITGDAKIPPQTSSHDTNDPNETQEDSMASESLEAPRGASVSSSPAPLQAPTPSSAGIWTGILSAASAIVTVRRPLVLSLACFLATSHAWRLSNHTGPRLAAPASSLLALSLVSVVLWLASLPVRRSTVSSWGNVASFALLKGAPSAYSMLIQLLDAMCLYVALLVLLLTLMT